MGNHTSQPLPPSSPPVWENVDLDALQSRLEALEQADESSRSDVAKRLKKLERFADANGDGKVTRDEMESYMAMQLKLREDELIRLRHELDRVREEYDTLSKTHDDTLTKIHEGRTDEIQSSAVSDRAIDKFVDDIIADPNTNIYGFPDKLERAMYRKSAKMTLVGLEKVFENIALEVIGHRIRISMQPLRPDEEE